MTRIKRFLLAEDDKFSDKLQTLKKTENLLTNILRALRRDPP